MSDYFDNIKMIEFKEVDRIVNWLELVIKKMCEMNLSHRDLHWGNIGYYIDPHNKATTLYLLDFGRSRTEVYCTPTLDTILLIKHLKEDYNFKNKEYFVYKLEELQNNFKK